MSLGPLFLPRCLDILPLCGLLMFHLTLTFSILASIVILILFFSVFFLLPCLKVPGYPVSPIDKIETFGEIYIFSGKFKLYLLYKMYRFSALKVFHIYRENVDIRPIGYSLGRAMWFFQKEIKTTLNFWFLDKLVLHKI